MTVIFLLRHAHSEANGAGILAGQMSGIHLSKVGKREAKTFAKNYRHVKFDQIYISPLERCSETIAPYLAQFSKTRRPTKPIIENLNFIEMDYGAWSGLKLQKLALKPLWRKIQNNPITVTFPEGESFRS
jgi:broad specificity phosphatase PhoE